MRFETAIISIVGDEKMACLHVCIFDAKQGAQVRSVQNDKAMFVGFFTDRNALVFNDQ